MSIRYLLSFDIDNTLIDLQTHQSIFYYAWQEIDTNGDLILCYNTGRLVDDVLQLIKKRILPVPDFIIGGVGTTIYDVQAGKVMKKFSEILEEGWNLSVIPEVIDSIDLPISDQPSRYQHEYKRSYFLEGADSSAISMVEEALQTKGLDVNVVYSGSKYLDVLPKWANKGNALRWLCRQLQINAAQIIVAGDSGNDSAMFTLNGIRRILISNAQPELQQATANREVFRSQYAQSKGVLDGLFHYNIIYEPTYRKYVLEETHTLHKVDERIIEFLDDEQIVPTNSDELNFIRQGYEKAVEAVKLNITPMGFSACSLQHNTTTGTDENYRSVWARDGAITVIGTIPLTADVAIRKCQKATLSTLLRHISPNGQIPANVSIDRDAPDYSGVGGICSIDSGLWFMIAFYEYIQATQDIDFLREHAVTIEKIMFWLAAQDANNDALLEIPEAGDWTDLFGRSYHILYDEVLWYRANVCYGRMLEKLGKNEQAGQYIRWGQVIKKAIIHDFWPTTQRSSQDQFNFALRQQSLGDSEYLIAQVTPFDFSWRCDIYGNVLAYLFDVIDTDKATKAFRFMWGTGVNDPYPVANVYPTVSPGDPDWRPYYTVNLLNLPNHYHNGGIWPFVGAAWVQFIHKLGLDVLEHNELYKLASLNHLGIQYEWEFNEWAHGKTGRPMGKRYQAWSAAQYVLTCHQLGVV